jgi:hypothetical protein
MRLGWHAVALAGAVIVAVIAAVTVWPSASQTRSPVYISTAGGDFVGRAVSWFPVWVTLPAGYSRHSFAFEVVERLRPSRPTYVSRTAIETDFETYGRCLWMQDWMSAREANDLDGMALASNTLRQSATWPATALTRASRVPALRALAKSAAELEFSRVLFAFTSGCPPLPPSSTSG